MIFPGDLPPLWLPAYLLDLSFEMPLATGEMIQMALIPRVRNL